MVKITKKNPNEKQQIIKNLKEIYVFLMYNLGVLKKKSEFV